jgi:hypothetical protein
MQRGLCISSMRRVACLRGDEVKGFTSSLALALVGRLWAICPLKSRKRVINPATTMPKFDHSRFVFDLQ